jgi:hypothetical protein
LAAETTGELVKRRLARAIHKAVPTAAWPTRPTTVLGALAFQLGDPALQLIEALAVLFGPARGLAAKRHLIGLLAAAADEEAGQGQDEERGQPGGHAVTLAATSAETDCSALKPQRWGVAVHEGLGYDRAMRRVGSGLAAFLCVASMLLAGGCGGSDEPSQERINSERRDAAQQAKQEERIKQLEREQRNLKKQGGSGGASGGATGGGSGGTPAVAGRKQCGGGLAVGANTTCPFAQVVREAYNDSGGASTFTAHSPVTDQDYSMSCTGGSPHVCTGGNNASVYFP